MAVKYRGQGQAQTISENKLLFPKVYANSDLETTASVPWESRTEKLLMSRKST